MLEITRDVFNQEVLDSDKLVLIDFWAEWCGPCKAMAPVLEEVAKKFPNSVKIVKVNVDTNSKFAEEFDIRGIPTILFFMNGRKLETSIVGFRDEKYIEDTITKVIEANSVLF